MSSYPSGTVTFLFTDIEGSTKLAREHPKTWEDARMRHHAILREAIEGNNGYIFQIIGDAFCAAFHKAGNALKAAIQTQQQLQNESWGDVVIRVRMGIHTNEAELTEDGQYQGYLTLSLVQRIMSAGYGGQILVSQTAYDLTNKMLSPGLKLHDLGEHRFKDFPQTERIYQLVVPGLVNDFPPLRTLANSPNNLPLQPTTFIGREAELATLTAFLADSKVRLVTIIGPGGIGKTRLSIEAARAALTSFPDGVFFVALAPVDVPNLITAAMAQALGYVGAKNISTTEQLKEGIADKALILVLDNCEHLIEAVASLVSDILSACSHLKILTTSRESLRIPDEWLYTVPTFDLPADRSSLDVESASKYPALTLFAERARAVRSDFSLNPDNLETVAAICARLDGLPLAIELIAARIRLMSPQALLERLSAQFILTADRMRAASERQKTLHNAIDWSYKLLPLEEQKLFAYLSVFSGSFTLEAVEAMFSQKIAEKPLSTLIALLLDKSLIKFAPELKASDEARYTMLATIQEYALERLQEMGEETEIRNEHLAYFLDISEKAREEMRGPNQLEWLHRLLGLRNNLRAALDWAIETGQTEVALQITRNLHWFWMVHSDHNEARYSFARVLALSDVSLYPSLYAEILTQFAYHIAIQTDGLQVREAKPLVEQALEIARAHDDKRNIGRALAMLGYLLTFGESEGEFMMAQSLLEESKELFLEVNDEWEYAQAVICLARNTFRQNKLALAFTLHKQGLSLFQKIGDRFHQSWAIYYMGMNEARQGNVKGGIAKLREALMLARQLDSRFIIGGALWRLSQLTQLAGDPARTVRLYWASKNISDSIGAWNKNDDSNFENTMAACRAALTEVEFEEAVEQGRAMTLEQAVEYALEDLDS